MILRIAWLPQLRPHLDCRPLPSELQTRFPRSVARGWRRRTLPTLLLRMASSSLSTHRVAGNFQKLFPVVEGP